VTEGPVIVQYIADQAAAKNLAPANGSDARRQLQEYLGFINGELHKNFSPLFQPVFDDEVKGFFKTRLMGKFKYLDGQLAGKDYLLGKDFSVADGYLFVMLKWADRMSIDLSEFKNLMTYKDRVAARPQVQAALEKEGLMKAA
jgi:glutathione S-transferase